MASRASNRSVELQVLERARASTEQVLPQQALGISTQRRRWPTGAYDGSSLIYSVPRRSTRVRRT